MSKTYFQNDFFDSLTYTNLLVVYRPNHIENLIIYIPASEENVSRLPVLNKDLRPFQFFHFHYCTVIQMKRFAVSFWLN